MNEIKLKRVEKHDKLLIYSWFNELENIKLKIKTKHKISIREHNIWFNKMLHSKKKRFWLIITKNKIAGQIRLDLIDKDIFEVDIFIIKNLRGLNIASNGLALAEKKLKKGSAIISTVKKNNKRSLVFFKNCNYHIFFENRILWKLKKVV